MICFFFFQKFEKSVKRHQKYLQPPSGLPQRPVILLSSCACRSRVCRAFCFFFFFFSGLELLGFGPGSKFGAGICSFRPPRRPGSPVTGRFRRFRQKSEEVRRSPHSCRISKNSCRISENSSRTSKNSSRISKSSENSAEFRRIRKNSAEFAEFE